MGAGNGWRCKKCGAGEEYWTGCGMASFNVEETRNRIAKGEFGKLARQLLSEDFPLQVGTVDEKVFFRCSTCSKLVEGMNVRFCVRDERFDLVLHLPPDACPECGEEFCFDDDCTPVSEGEIIAIVASVLESGCPVCGSRDVKPTLVKWD